MLCNSLLLWSCRTNKECLGAAFLLCDRYFNTAIRDGMEAILIALGCFADLTLLHNRHRCGHRLHIWHVLVYI